MSDGHAEKTKAQVALVEDFRKFRREPSADTRATLVGRICDEFNEQTFSGQEKALVKDILDILSRDVERTIRRVLAEKLKASQELPHDIALRLAQDVEEVSMPILQFSEVLTDQDLEAVIASAAEATKLVAIAKRPSVSERVSTALVNTDNANVVVTLVGNKGAAIAPAALERVVEVFKQSENMMETLVQRGNLPVQVAERMVMHVSTKLQKELTRQYSVAPKVAHETVRDAREETTLEVLPRNLDRNATHTLVAHLHSTGRLSHSIVLRALCRADLVFFEAGIAKLANVPFANASTLLAKGDRKAFEALYQSAYMPPTMMEATEILMRLIHREPPGIEGPTRQYFSRLIGRILGEGYDRDVPNMRYFLTLINESSSSAGQQQRAVHGQTAHHQMQH